MRVLLLFLTYIYVSLPVECRLIPKLTESTTEAKSDDLSSSRVTRSIYEYEGIRGISKEYDASNEYSTGERKRTVFSRMANEPDKIKISRIVRESSNETPTEAPDKTIPKPEQQTTSKGVFVKKPIPKYNEKDYDEDFQTKVIRSQTKLADSGEHEDEDFNVDDYDFDVNHDEFSGRGKPLEPRVKDKRILEQNIDPETEIPVPAPVAAPTSIARNHNKVTAVKVITKRNNAKIRTVKRSTEKDGSKKASKKISNKDRGDDYYDENSSKTTEAPEADNFPNRHSADEADYDQGSKQMKHRATRSSLPKAPLLDGWKQEKASMVKRLMSATSYDSESPFVSEPLIFTWF